MRHAAGGHPAPAWFAGATSPDGWWWWFPAAYLVKVPVGMQLLTLGVVLFGARAMVGEGARRGFALAARGWASDPLRAPLAGVAVYGAFLLRSDLNIGFRYAIPLLPLVCVAVGAGVVRAARTPSSVALLGVSTLVALQLSSTLSAAPHFLAFESVWARGRPPGEEVLLDSSRDWGQGLVALRRWMDEEGVEAVDLSYFGSALPEGYGIAYRSLPSFLPLPPSAGLAEGGPAPTWTAISATNLVGLCLAGDPLAEWRSRPPDHSVAGGTIYLWRGGVP
jgi:hypothetical protein